jgi:dTDP-4-amino-4,6-dideoxygalactose transaminase
MKDYDVPSTLTIDRQDNSVAPQDHHTFAPWPYFAEDEIEAVTRVLQSGKVNYWTGEEGRLFEIEFAKVVGSKYAIAVANGTVALELALRALGVGPGDEVITTSRTFIASASSAVMVGARPVIADVDRDSQNITVDSIRAALTPRTKAIIVVHLAGWPCDMDPIRDLARSKGIYLVEDCAQSQGASYKTMSVGSLSDIAAFSFCQDKIMTTGGEGGMITTNDAELWSRVWALKDHGKCFDTVYNQEHPPGFRWLHESFGTNGRMSEMQAALGRVSLRKIPAWVAARRKNAAALTRHLEDCSALRIPLPTQEFGHSYYKYYAFVRPELLRSNWSRDRIMTETSDRGVPCMAGSCSEIHRELAFTRAGLNGYATPVAHELGNTSLMFLVHPTLTPENIARTCEVVQQVLETATK